MPFFVLARDVRSDIGEGEKKANMPKDRIKRLKKAVQDFRPGVCTERALLWTEYFRKKENRRKSIYTQMAEALRDVLLKKTIRIYPDELIVGNFSSKRVGGSIYPTGGQGQPGRLSRPFGEGFRLFCLFQ